MTKYHTDNREARLYTTAISKGGRHVGRNSAVKLEVLATRKNRWDGILRQKVQSTAYWEMLTAYRTREIVRRVFAPRFLKPTG